MKNLLIRILSVSAALILAASAGAAVTPITVQGSIKAAGGAPVSGPHSMVFRIYDNATTGTQLWTETHGSVAFSNGIYSALLGSSASLEGVFGNGLQRWLGVSLDGGTEFSPRQQLSATAYANYSHEAGTARSLDGVTSAGFALAGHTHKQMIVYGGTTGQSVAAGTFMPLNGGGGSASYARNQTPAIANMTVTKMMLRVPPFYPSSVTLTLYKNGVSTGFSVSKTGFNPIEYYSAIGSVPVIAGDTLALHSSATSSDGFSYSLLAELE